MTDKIVIVGVGNLLLKDEGIGIHTARALEDMNLPENVEIIDAGTSPDLIAYTEPGCKLIIVDAARAGGEPGTVYRLKPDDLASEAGQAASAHELGVDNSLRLMKLKGSQPREIVIFGVEPEEISWGLELSGRLQEKLPHIVETVIAEINHG